jgi:hypothetical protein
MPNAEWSEIAAEAMERDPREYRFGYYTGGSFVLDSTRVFVWFASLDELIRQVLEIEPRVHDLEPGEGLEEFQARIGPVLERARKEGLTEELRDTLKPEQDGFFVIEWWGTFDDLCRGEGEFARGVLDDFLGEDREGQELKSGEENDFAEFVQQYGF